MNKQAKIMLDFSSFDDLKHAQEAIRLAKEIVEFVGDRWGMEKETIEGEEFQKLMKSTSKPRSELKQDSRDAKLMKGE